jgi:hypothetical protein
MTWVGYGAQGAFPEEALHIRSMTRGRCESMSFGV